MSQWLSNVLWWKFAKFLMSLLEAQVSFPSNFVSSLSAINHNSFVLSKLKHYMLWSKAARSSANFWDFWELGSKCVKFLMSILNWQVNSFSNFASFFIDITHKVLVNFKLIHLLLWIKGPNKSPNFAIFVCSDEELPNSSYHFPNHKSLFLQTLHHSLVSWNITPLYFFSSNIMYFGQKQPINV